jgi:hypothetical protein
MTDAQASSFNRINAAYDAQAPAQPNAPPVAKMNALWKAQASALQQTIDGAIKTGQVDDSTGAALQTALQQAAVHKSALDTNLLNKLNSSAVDPKLSTTLRNGLVDLDHMSQMVNAKQTTGPFAALASKITSAAAPIGALAAGVSGDWRTAAELGVSSMLGHGGGLAGKLGAAAGGVLDRVAGTNLPQSLILRSQALKQAQAAGLDTSTDAVSPVVAANDGLNALQAQQGQAAAEAVARAKAADLMEAAANKLSGQDYKNSEEGIVARARLTAQRADIIAQAKADGRIPVPLTQDQRDRMSIGLSPSDPIPVNVPLGAGNVPLGQTASGTSQGPRPAVPQGQQPAPLQVAPATPGGAPQAGATLPVGWLSHFHTALGNTGIPATADNVGKALGGAVASGRITQDYANWLLANPDQFVGDRSVPFQHLVAQAMQNNGMQPSPVVAPVQVPIKHANAVQDYRNLGNSLQSQAAAQSDPTLAVAIARIVASSSAQKKMDIADQVLSQRQHDAVALARAKLLLPPELFSRGK